MASTSLIYLPSFHIKQSVDLERNVVMYNYRTIIVRLSWVVNTYS